MNGFNILNTFVAVVLGTLVGKLLVDYEDYIMTYILSKRKRWKKK